jgi:hypothetical protein
MPAHGFAALHPALGDPSLCGTLALDGVRSAIGDPFLWSGCAPHIAQAAKIPTWVKSQKMRWTPLSSEATELRKTTLPEAAEAYAHSSRVA